MDLYLLHIILLLASSESSCHNITSESISYYVTFVFGQMAVYLMVPDVPHEVTIQQQRQEFLTDKVVLRVADDIEGGGGTNELEKIEIHEYPTAPLPRVPARAAADAMTQSTTKSETAGLTFAAATKNEEEEGHAQGTDDEK